MTQTRSLLLIAWLFLAGWLWLQWNQFNATPAAPPAAMAPAAVATPTPGTGAALPAPAAALPGEPALPAVELPGGSVATGARADAPVVRLRNDVLELALDAHGNVVDSHLLGYQQEKRAGSPDVQLLSTGDGKRYVARAGLIH